MPPKTPRLVYRALLSMILASSVACQSRLSRQLSPQSDPFSNQSNGNILVSAPSLFDPAIINSPNNSNTTVNAPSPESAEGNPTSNQPMPSSEPPQSQANTTIEPTPTADTPPGNSVMATPINPNAAVAGSSHPELSLKIIRHGSIAYSIDLILKNGKLIQNCLYDWMIPGDSSEFTFGGRCADQSSHPIQSILALRLFASDDNWASASNAIYLLEQDKLKYTFDFIPFRAWVMDISGAITDRSFSFHLEPQPNHRGLQGAIYVVAFVDDKKTYFMNSHHEWILDDGKTPKPAFFSGELPTSFDHWIVKNTNLQLFEGTKIFIGYGIGSETFKEMAISTRYKMIYRVEH